MSTIQEKNEAQPLRMLPLRFLLRSAGMNFPEFSGSAWHGGLGMTLAQHAPQAFDRLYQTAPESRLYALLPPLAQRIAGGEPFELRITLFGHGTEHALAVTQAIAELGRSGLRPGGHYEMLAASSIDPQGETPFLTAQAGFIALPHTRAAQEYLPPVASPIPACRIQFATPLRIKEGNDLLRAAPGYAQLLRRTFGRIDQLAHVAGETPPLAKNLRAELYAQAERVQIQTSTINAHRLERRSARSGQQMQFGGIVGAVEYTGEMQTTLPWLKLARLAQLGGKTAFGFGGIEIETSNPHQN